MRKSLTTLSVVGFLLASLSPAEAGWEEGVAAFKARNYRTAAAEFQSVVELQPNEPAGHLMLGRSLLALKQTDKAVEHLRKAAELNPNDVQTQVYLGQGLYQAGRYRETTQVLGKVNPSSLPKQAQSVVYQMRGAAYQATGQTDRALADLKRAAELNPNSAKAWYNYGAAALNAANVGAAVPALGKAVSLDGNDAVKRKAYIQALVLKGRQSRGSEKEATYQKAVSAARALNQSSYDNVLLLGEVQLGAKQYDSAIATLKKAGGMNSGDWYPLFYLGQAYTAKKQYPQAEPPLKTALKKTSSSADQKRIWSQLGYVYEKQKDFNRAITAYRSAGNSAGVARAQENAKIAEENRKIEEHNRQVQELEKEAKALEEELKTLPGGVPPR